MHACGGMQRLTRAHTRARACTQTDSVEGCSDTGLATLVRGGERGQIGIRGDGAKRRRAARDDELEENVGLREVEGDEVLSSKFQEGGGASSGRRVAKVRYGDQHVGAIKGSETIGLENTMKWERDEREGCTRGLREQQTRL
jgi:hypothetical protein